MLIELPEGVVFWTLDKAIPTSDAGKPRPTLLFLHAGVADHTQWDDQVVYFTEKGWNVLRYDRFGFGQSVPSPNYLEQQSRPAIKHYEHTAHVVKAYNESISESGEEKGHDVVLVGSSMGGGCAIDFTLQYPYLVAGLVVIAGALGGFEALADPREEEFGAEKVRLEQAKDVEGLARLSARFWGDGPLQKEGRANSYTRDKLYTWCKDIATRELSGTGGFALRGEAMDPPACSRLSEIQAPVAVGIGKYDETETITTMRYVAEHARRSTVQEFDAAHMVNLECPKEFNSWLEEWLNKL